MNNQPEYPITIVYSNGSDEETFDDEKEMVRTLEWFDSGDEQFHATAFDRRGRKVHVIIRELQLATFETVTEF